MDEITSRIKVIILNIAVRSSGNLSQVIEKLYTDLIEPLGHKAKEKNEEFDKEHAKIVNIFTQEFCDKFCTNGEIDWEALVRFNSAEEDTKPQLDSRQKHKEMKSAIYYLSL